MITLRNITLRRGVKVVLQNANLVLQPGEKVGLIGRNGAGKSSLFSLLTNRLQADTGDVEIPPRWRLGEVAQNMPETDDGATDFVLQGDIPLVEAQTALTAAEASGDGHAIAEAHMRLDEAGAFDARSRAQALLLGLGFRSDQLDAPVNSFSGGWRMRLQLARALMCPADLLLLDEPTNHLDLDALVWLEAWLKRFDGLMVVISHDREFLDAITRVTVHLDDCTLTRYGGNYSTFEEMRAERMSQQQAAFAKQQEKIAHLQRFIDRFKAKATKAKQAQSRVKALARMEKLAPVLTASDFEFEFREPASLPNPMLSLDGLVCGYGRIPIVQKVSRSVLAGQRIGILGANGQGKSTLVKTIARALPPLAGTMTEGKGLVIGYFAQQELDVLSLDDGPLMHMVRLARDVGPAAREQELRDFLGRFRFTGDMVTQAVGSLSGGEKARLVLAMLVWQRPNLLLLDEPTNHLDLTTREALSIALNEFEGTVMLVSHDRALLRETCDEFWLVSRGGVEPFDGDLDDYQRWLLEVSRATARGQEPPPPPRPAAFVPATPVESKAAPPARPAPQAAGDRREDRKQAAHARQALANRTRPLRNELAQIDTRLEKLAAERAALEAQLASGTMSGAEIAEAGRRLNHAAAETGLLEERWLELQTEIEALQADN
ncbi:ABC-F family ATP-binding cassette domain-containing protein [Rubrivivax gelatinosus]|uniref:Probable ATP-binding protein YheS n=1 Tax=Rubrivivax gelatinosus TaxID=28068 RepID=A0A4R2MG92_RUBGE|nr:ATP-binding cassette domain-containing protein [Rubrivivax gelatinosus]MBK1689775.1 ABC transporter [Rubrivivax gelatinosus]TCP04275.1 ATP-binding cassette subfamily F protein 3 [Rubrivivax gelatinosus]